MRRGSGENAGEPEKMNHGFSTVDFETISCIDYSASKLLKAIRYHAKDGTIYEIPQYQPTDFASIPKIAWGFPLYLIPTGWYSIPVIGHDSAFQNLLLKVLPDGSKVLANLSEFQCNDLLLEMMQSIKPNATTFERAQMDAIYTGVTIGGYHSYKEDRA